MRGSGNVFRDFGDPNAELRQMKAILAAAIIKTLDRDKLSVRDAEKLTGVPYAEFSRIRHAKKRAPARRTWRAGKPAMTSKKTRVMATVANSKELQAMLKNPKFREAWDGFIDELDEGLALIEEGGQPTGEATGVAAQRVLEA